MARLSSLLAAGGVIVAGMVACPAAPSAPTLTYNATTACIAHEKYVNDVLPRGVGEFGTNGLDRAYWGGRHARTLSPKGTWQGFQTSWGRHQYDTYFSDVSDGLGLDPFAVTADTAAPGSPVALRITAAPLGNRRFTAAVLQHDHWAVTAISAPFSVPSNGGTVVLNVANPNGAQNTWTVGIGNLGDPVMFVGTLQSGGAVTGVGGGGASPWTITNIHLMAGAPGTVITPGHNDGGGLQAYNFPDYYAGVLDTHVDQEYGLFAARIRLPNYLPALSPAFWTLATGGVQTINGKLNDDELDIEEMMGTALGNALNANQILWQQPITEGVGKFTVPGTPQADYHDYAVLASPQGTTFYLDGRPIPGDVNLPDGTQGSSDKEVMLMFQVGGPGTWLDPSSKAMTGNPWPQYLWAQWIRIYRPTGASC